MQITNRIHFRNLRGDFLGGIVAAIIALPMALTFGVASGAGAAAGLWGAVLVGFFAALFGGTPTLISEPTGPMTVIMTAVIANLTASYPENGLAMAFTVVMLAGIFQILFGVLRLGKYITLMPYTVISGFMSGIGIILIILQIPPFLGQERPDGAFETILTLPELLGNINPAATILAALTVAIIVFMPVGWKRIIPGQLVALVLGTVISLIFFSGVNLRRIGEIPMGLPELQMPTFSAEQLQMMLVEALILATLGCIDAMLTSLVADSLTRSEHNSNKELIGQGIGNFASGLCGGIAGAGATMGTVVNIQTGGTTALSGLTRALILFVIVIWAAPLLQSIPLAVLAGIALKVGIDIIDWGFLKRAHQVSVKAAIIMYGVIALTVFVDLMVAVGVGVFVANILTIERLSNLRAEKVKAVSNADDEIMMDDQEKQLLDRANGRVLLFYLSGPMIFGVSNAIARQRKAMEDQDHNALILDLRDVPHLGVSSSLAVENAIREAVDKGRHVFIVGAADQSKQRLENLGILSLIPPQHLLMDRQEALRQAVTLVEGKEQPAKSI
ncbi:MAG: sodium-independent anion transporter [Cyanobacteria bacterium QH_8_48_120]|nr:MAG: sodium-independent anion transporter [Cyanobacteria bacterium QH_6_48_35]PSO75411.1 MAG: sodium-independent anion transporter [Cyanobacteria bacterium QH_8_48_120]